MVGSVVVVSETETETGRETETNRAVGKKKDRQANGRQWTDKKMYKEA